MGFIPEITCRHCGKKFSAIHNRCPHCGTRRVKQSSRAPTTTASARQGTSANSRASVNAKWQFIFGCVLVVAVIAAVIVLISASLSTGSKEPIPTPTPTVTVTPTPTPTPPPTPTPSPTPNVTSITITYMGNAVTEFTQPMGTTIDLDAVVYPIDVEAEVEWSSDNEEVFTIDENGVLTPVAPGWGTVIVTCGGITASCRVLVR